MDTSRFNEPHIQILGYSGTPFPTEFISTVRFILTNADHWQRGVQFTDPALHEWNYVPHYEGTIEVRNYDPSTKALNNPTPGNRKTFSVFVMMNNDMFRHWHCNKGSGYNNCDARREFIEAWIEYCRKELAEKTYNI